MTLDELRTQIDALDARIVELLNQRADLACQIGQIKNAYGAAVYAPAREREVLDRVRRLNRGPLPDACLTAIWREVMSASLALEKPLKVGYLGPAGTFSHLAAVARFGHSVECLPRPDIATIFEDVARGHVDHGVLPIENSVAGGVGETLDGLFRHDGIRIGSEILLRVRHHLLSRADSLDQLRRIYSKPEGFAQCRRFLSGLSCVEELPPPPGRSVTTRPAEAQHDGPTPQPQIELVAVSSTARGAQLASEDPHAAAIGSRLASELHGLAMLCQSIEDDPDNTTRFIVVGRSSAKPTGRDKTALLIGVPHRSGGLRDVLEILAAAGVNLTWLEPHSGGRLGWSGWSGTAGGHGGRAAEFRFFVDAEGHADDPPLARAIEQLRSRLPRLTVLGSYPRADEPLA